MTDGIAFDDALLDKVGHLVKGRPEWQRRTGDDTAYRRFLEQYPPERLGSLTLEEYCLGKGSQPENFCWWIERGLQKALGRYMPGSARGHLIYRKPDGSYYINGQLADMGPEAALRHVCQVLHYLASVPDLASAVATDDDPRLVRESGIGRSVTVGNARRLRLLNVYHPDWVIPINSPDHLREYLRLFGYQEEAIPRGAFARNRALFEVFETVRDRYEPGLTPFGFMMALYSDDLGIRPASYSSKTEPGGKDPVDTVETVAEPLNLILYGPPGTGKTYRTVDRALAVLDPAFLDAHENDRASLRKRFSELRDAGRIGFVTFHQSFGYEDFVEGLRATVDDEGRIAYVIEDGILKRMSEAASSITTQTAEATHRIGSRTVWKMSLGNTLKADEEVFEECVEKGYVLLGYGGTIDFSGVRSRDEVLSRYSTSGVTAELTDYRVTAVDSFVREMAEGDLVIVSDGNLQYRAVGEIAGDYRLLTAADGREGYLQCRPVSWLRVFAPSRPVEEIYERNFSQKTLYKLGNARLRIEALERVLGARKDAISEVGNYVLIIDEINRANIAKVFGELITLIEPDKRAGAPEEVKARLPYSKNWFSLPQNLYLIGTMNTADRSLAQLDIALRRRFLFEEMLPNPNLLRTIGQIEGIDLAEMLQAINDRIELLYDRDHTVGHSLFVPLADDPSLGRLADIFDRQLLPLLEEYFYEDWERIRLVLGDHLKPSKHAFIQPRFSGQRTARLMGADWQQDQDRPVAWKRNPEAFEAPEAYIGIYAPETLAPGD